MNKRAICIFMAAALMLLTPVSTLAVTKSEAEKNKKEAQKGLDTVKSQINDLEEDKETLEEEIQEIDNELVDMLLTVDIIKGDIADKEEQIRIATEEYEEARNKEETQYEAMKRRIKFMYEKGDASYLEMFLQTKSISELINKADYVEQLYAYDRQLLTEYQNTKDEVLEKKNILEVEMSELEEMQADAIEQSETLQAMIEEKQAVLEDFDSKLTAAKNKASEYQSKIKEQTAVIKQIEAAEAEAARKKAEAEAAAKKKAEEEAKRKAEEAKKNNESILDIGGNNSETITDEPAPEPEPTPAPEPASPGDSSKGREIANFACQFVGNPYVAGGVSLTDGCDCSGFTLAVYNHFGYSLPRNSYSQSQYGRAVSYAEAQPGDIIYYGGHVGIYIGGGQIVHASTAATGIKISNASYRSIITVRRIV